ncbi:hypothetical protein [Hydrogenobacter hydrogenophilus]
MDITELIAKVLGVSNVPCGIERLCLCSERKSCCMFLMYRVELKVGN